MFFQKKSMNMSEYIKKTDFEKQLKNKSIE